MGKAGSHLSVITSLLCMKLSIGSTVLLCLQMKWILSIY